MKLSPGCNCCSTCVATLVPGVHGCPNYVYPNNATNTGVPGISWTATQGGVLVASGTTDASGNSPSFTVSSTATATMSYSGLLARVGSGTFNVTPVCGSSVGAGMGFGFYQVGPSCTVSSMGTFNCLSNCTPIFGGNNCIYPVAASLTATTSVGSGTATYGTPSTTAAWTMFLSDGSGGTYSWSFSLELTSSGAVQFGHRDSHGTVLASASGPVGSYTCPSAGTGYSASGTVTGTAGTLTWAISE